jgi:hypothetical protein
MRALSLLILFFSFSNISFADADTTGHGGKWFFSWGYNRDYYQDSDISLHGTNASGQTYDYTLHDVKASDTQSPFQWQYLFPNMTIPQTNERLGYYLDGTHRINVGVDHMKYVVDQGQTVLKSGTDPSSLGTAPYQTITSNYLAYEHTDGLNYISIGYETLYPFWQNSILNLSFVQGPDVGILYPKTNVTMSGQGELRNDDFHLAGYGAAYKVGLIADIGRHWFLQLDFKEGLLNMPWIRISNNPNDGATQRIQFFEGILALGYVF